MIIDMAKSKRYMYKAMVYTKWQPVGHTKLKTFR